MVGSKKEFLHSGPSSQQQSYTVVFTYSSAKYGLPISRSTAEQYSTSLAAGSSPTPTQSKFAFASFFIRLPKYLKLGPRYTNTEPLLTPRSVICYLPWWTCTAPVYHPAFDLCAESRQARYNLQITTPRIMTSRKTMPRITGVAFR